MKAYWIFDLPGHLLPALYEVELEEENEDLHGYYYVVKIMKEI